MNKKNRSLIFVLIAVLSWSTVATSFKIALRYFSHFEMLVVAALTAFLILALVTTVQRKWSYLSQLSKNSGEIRTDWIVESGHLLFGVV